MLRRSASALWRARRWLPRLHLPKKRTFTTRWSLCARARGSVSYVRRRAARACAAPVRTGSVIRVGLACGVLLSMFQRHSALVINHSLDDARDRRPRLHRSAHTDVAHTSTSTTTTTTATTTTVTTLEHNLRGVARSFFSKKPLVPPVTAENAEGRENIPTVRRLL